MFEKAFVINLPFKTDRLAQFQENVPACLGEITVWPAVHGDTVRHPAWWTAGPGAWGCYRSHMQILEHCYQHKIESYVVFEDDAIFRPDFKQSLATFLELVPNDWEQVYLGGQLYHDHQHPPRKVNDSVYVPYNVNRTHCFAVHRRGYEKLYKFLNQVPFADQEHIDHHLGRLHESGKLRIYCPSKWMVGQDSGPSNISGQHNGATYWTDPEKCSSENRKWQNKPVVPVFLEAPLEVAIDLERRGWHRGKWQNAQRLDRGVCEALSSLDVKAGLVQWYKAVTPEAVREGNPCVCLYHPTLTWACVESLPCAKFHRIVATTAEDAERQLSEILDDVDGSRSTRIRRRNLIYHIWPRKGNGVWQWNVAELLKRIDQFDGSRSIGIATSDDADSVEAVRAAFANVRIDNWLIVENDPKLGEVVTFPKLLSTLPRDDSVTFYGHAKGVKYHDPNTTHEWTAALYEVCLDDPAFVDASLEHYPITGPLINREIWKEVKHGWHYSGSFYWFKNSAAFALSDWDQVTQSYWGSEMWPGDHFPREQAGSLFGTNIGRLYDPNELARMRAWLIEWRANRRPAATVTQPTITGSSISIVIPTIGRAGLRRMLDTLTSQLGPSDQIIVVADGDEARLRCWQQLQAGIDARIRFETHVDPQSCYGNAQRNHGRSLAAGDLIWFVDDDDQVASDALATIRTEAHPQLATMFRMRHEGRLLWTANDIVPGNVSGQMLVVPNVPSVPAWPVPAKNPHLSDNEWIQRVAKSIPIRWSQSVIYEITKHNMGKLDA